jgi:hypothetical protein
MSRISPPAGITPESLAQSVRAVLAETPTYSIPDAKSLPRARKLDGSNDAAVIEPFLATLAEELAIKGIIRLQGDEEYVAPSGGGGGGGGGSGLTHPQVLARGLGS